MAPQATPAPVAEPQRHRTAIKNPRRAGGVLHLPGRVHLSAGLATGSLLYGLRLRLFSADLLQLFDPGLPFVVGLFALLLLELFAHGVDLLDQFSIRMSPYIWVNMTSKTG